MSVPPWRAVATGVGPAPAVAAVAVAVARAYGTEPRCPAAQCAPIPPPPASTAPARVSSLLAQKPTKAE